MRAGYAGWCHVCDEAVRPGDDIRKVDADDTWVHVDCLTRLEEAAATQFRLASRPRCPYCADLLTPTGSCDGCGRS